MATRGIVAHSLSESANTWQGRYSHWDNYPERMTYVLGELVARDGVDKVIKTLITDTASWSQIEPMAKSGTPNLYEDKALIEGYGYAHTDVELDDPSALFTNDDTEFAWCDYVYIIHHDYLEVRTIVRDEKTSLLTTEPLTFHAWDTIAIKEVTA